MMRTAGVLFFPRHECVQTPPFLSVAQRVRYLYDRQYFEEGTVTDKHAVRLEEVNFHYFLGYARNYRALVGRKLIDVDRKSPDDVFRVIDADARMSALLHRGLRAAEWRLRSVVVEKYCSKFDSAGSFLEVAQYRATEKGSRERLVASLLTHIYRHDEPYVDHHIRERCAVTGGSKPHRYEPAVHQACLNLASELPLWSVVDSFSLGLLGQFVMCCDTDHDSPVWKEVAKELDIGAKVFETQIRSVAYLRNSVAHHARLWMRPTSDSPKRPRLFKKDLRDTHPKSMSWAFLNLATFLGGAQRREFANDVLSLLDEEDLYRYGVTQVFENPKEADREPPV